LDGRPAHPSEKREKKLIKGRDIKTALKDIKAV